MFTKNIKGFANIEKKSTKLSNEKIFYKSEAGCL